MKDIIIFSSCKGSAKIYCGTIERGEIAYNNGLIEITIIPTKIMAFSPYSNEIINFLSEEFDISNKAAVAAVAAIMDTSICGCDLCIAQELHMCPKATDEEILCGCCTRCTAQCAGEEIGEIASEPVNRTFVVSRNEEGSGIVEVFEKDRVGNVIVQDGKMHMHRIDEAVRITDIYEEYASLFINKIFYAEDETAEIIALAVFGNQIEMCDCGKGVKQKHFCSYEIKYNQCEIECSCCRACTLKCSEEWF